MAKKQSHSPAELEAARERARKASKAVSATLPMTLGREPTPEDRAAFKAATEELAEATRELNRLQGGAAEDPATNRAQSMLARELGKKT